MNETIEGIREGFRIYQERSRKKDLREKKKLREGIYKGFIFLFWILLGLVALKGIKVFFPPDNTPLPLFAFALYFLALGTLDEWGKKENENKRH